MSEFPMYSIVIPIALFTSFVGDIQLRVVGKYVDRLHDEVEARPLSLVRDLRGLDHAAGVGARSTAPHSELARP